MLRAAKTASKLGGLGRALRANSAKTDRVSLHAFDNLFSGANGDYLDRMFDQWCEDPTSVSEEVKDLFEKSVVTDTSEPIMPENLRPISSKSSSAASNTPRSVLNAMRVGWMLRLWAVRGHRLADLDPLKLEGEGLKRRPGSAKVSDRPLFHPADFGFSDSELDQVIHLAVSDKVGGLLALNQEPMTLRQLYTTLRNIYAGKVGWEYMHIHDAKQLLWLRKRIETPDEQRVTLDHREIFHHLARAELFEKFLQIKFSNVKRFGLDGAEVLIPAMSELLEKSSELGVEAVVLGMPHRGRLNVLANLAGKPFGAIFGEFQGSGGHMESLEFGSGDVKYHLGFTQKKKMRSGQDMSISLAANPSHLEAVAPVVQGKTKAKQLFRGKGDEDGKKSVMSIVMHGDAAFAGQGVCFESMGLSDLKEYDVGGTIHIIVNNQIGFTTDPISSRSTPYCSDLGKAFGAPIFHVNADATAEVIKVFKLAAEWRAKYQQDVIIDLICYRRYGHNESDEPLFTQPSMYKKIAAHPTQLKIYGDKLVEDGILTREDIEAETAKVNELLKEDFKNLDQYQYQGRSPRAEWLESFWKGFKSPTQLARINPTAKSAEVLTDLGRQLTTFPAGFKPHGVVKRIIEARGESIKAGQGIDWPTAESLAFATLLAEGNHVRLSGQDVERGTFSQRHSVLHDQATGEKLMPLREFEGCNSDVTIQNSSLSEFGVLGFEVGFNSESPNQLVIWEAQFGDFANTAQVIFDQFLSAGEVKWFRQSGLVVNLPHGYDGAGPEHSSGRLERFLQMTAEPEENPHIDPVQGIQQCNWQVCYPTTPAQYFHVLRRQVHRDFRKPLIVFFAKSTLRAPNVSSLADFTPPTEFLPVIDDKDVVEPEKIRKLILCSGQIWFALNAYKKKNNVEDIALVRVEQLSPFPWNEVEATFKKYPNAELQWCQEESKNMGAWLYAEVRIENILEEIEDPRAIVFNGRRPSAAPATGLSVLHEMEHTELMTAAFV
eukprot:TRINITY_DN8321_c0_g2_i1.p1 TRINITY_DN8321_c0_g2~~TRINITY_DN8321_c0_g2_i1.p1  ORF type:complete len:997 (+),score=215.92 TRINITY_DN8321_c0_g2_i1:44-3034(+)